MTVTVTVDVPRLGRAQRAFNRFRISVRAPYRAPRPPAKLPTIAAPDGESLAERLVRYVQLAKFEDRRHRERDDGGCTVTTARRVREIVDAALVLDRVKPGWYRFVDVTCLELASTENCVLGQLYGDFTRGHYVVAQHHPYVINAFAGGSSDDVWRAEIELRRAAEAG